MPAKNRVKLEVGGINQSSHFAVIGDPIAFYIWYKAAGSKGVNSRWITGHMAFKHFNVMRQLLEMNRDSEGFISYLTDLYHVNVDTKKVA